MRVALYQFLTASQELEMREVQKALQAERNARELDRLEAEINSLDCGKLGLTLQVAIFRKNLYVALAKLRTVILGKD